MGDPSSEDNNDEPRVDETDLSTDPATLRTLNRDLRVHEPRSGYSPEDMAYS
jgi:hypothetical protein